MSDPGYRVVAAAIAAGARVVPVPGPSALLAALVGRRAADGQVPVPRLSAAQDGARGGGCSRACAASAFTLVLYESPLRVGATLADLAAALGADRRACVARELTKPHEEIVRDDVGALAARYADATAAAARSRWSSRARPTAAPRTSDDDELLANARAR